jgi:hypothetical protein
MIIAIGLRIALHQLDVRCALAYQHLGDCFVIRQSFFRFLALHAYRFVVVTRENPWILRRQSLVAPRAFGCASDYFFPVFQHLRSTSSAKNVFVMGIVGPSSKYALRNGAGSRMPPSSIHMHTVLTCANFDETEKYAKACPMTAP